jgi:FkbM family methyltransferase
MNLTAWITSLFPFTVNVSGKKHDLICRVGRILSGVPASVRHRGAEVQLKNHPSATIIGYAPKNFYNDFYFSELGKLLSLELKQGEVFVDVGANLGGYSFLASRLGAEVHLFEPFPELYSFLKENESVLGKVYPIALSDKESISVFHISDHNIGGSSLVDSNLNNAMSGYTRDVQVQTNKGDEVLKNIPFIHWLKIDVEGNEEAVTMGFEEMLRSKRIGNVWCEVRGPQSDRNANSYLKVCALMQSHGYSCYRVMQGKAEIFNFTQPQAVPQYFDLLFKAK